MLNGDDVFEDLVTAGDVLQRLALDEGLAAQVRYGTGVLTSDDGVASRAIVLYTARGAFGDAEQTALSALVAAGRALVVVHSGNVFGAVGDRLDERFRTAFELVGSRYRSHGPEPRWSTDTVELAEHPVTRGVETFELLHEHYQLELAADTQVVAWRAGPEGREPIAHVRQHGLGRVVYVQLGHDARSLGHPSFQRLVRQGLRWALSG